MKAALKMVTKPCPKCRQHLPVACKACPCGHVFFLTRRPISIHKVGRDVDTDGEVKRRRTERTKRERPDYFNSLQVENQWKRLKNLQKPRSRAENSSSSCTTDYILEGENSNSEEGNAAQNASTPRKRGRPKKNFSKAGKDEPKTVEKEEDPFANLSKEKEVQFSIILAEINRKMCGQQFLPAQP